MMNEVYLQGVVDALQPTDAPRQLVCRLCVSHHNRQGDVRHEYYSIWLWNGLAAWAESSLRPGMPVMIKGYLTQYSLQGRWQTAVTARRIWAGQAHRTDEPAEHELALPG